MKSVRQCLSEYLFGTGIEKELREEGRFYGAHQFDPSIFIDDVRFVGKSIRINRAVHYGADIISLIGTGCFVSSVFAERSWPFACSGAVMILVAECTRNVFQKHIDHYHKYHFPEYKEIILSLEVNRHNLE